MKLNNIDARLVGNRLTDGVNLYHHRVLDYMRKSTWYFENLDVVECDESLLDSDIREAIWSNIHLYSYDIKDKLFLKSFTFNLKSNDKLMYKIYFYLEDSNIFLFAQDKNGTDVIGATIVIQDGKFVPLSSVSDKYYEIFKINHVQENLPLDRQFVADRGALNCLLYIITVNEMITRNREIVTETSKRVLLPNKNNKKSNKKKKKKSNVKKLKEIRYIKIDAIKVRRIKEESELAKRGNYERHTKEWTRRGHYRTYKNGTRVWIEPSVVRAKSKTGEKKPKVYKLT